MRHRSLSTLTLFVAASAFGDIGDIPNQEFDGFIDLGDTFRGIVAPSDDVDVVEFEGVPGELVTLKVIPIGDEPTLNARIDLFDLQLQSVVASDDGIDGVVRLRKIELTSAGRFQAWVSSGDGSAGKFELRTKSKIPAGIRKVALEIAEDGGGAVEATIDAKPGMLVTIKAEPEVAPAVPGLPILIGPEGPIDLTPFTVLESDSVKVAEVPVPITGVYEIVVDNVGGGGQLKGVVKTKLPKGTGLLKERYTIFGPGLSPFEGSQDPNQGDVVSEQQVAEKIDLVADRTFWIRTWGVDGGLAAAGRLAHERGLKSAVGAWLGPNQAINTVQVNTAVDIALAGEADMVIVGSEVLLRGDLTKQQLLDHIGYVRAALPPEIPVVTAEVYFNFIAHADLIDAVDALLVNYYPYWEGIDIDDAMDHLACWHDGVQTLAGGKPVWVSETGWPSGGNSIGDAIPTEENAARYFLEFISWARENEIRYFYFEATDEPWKAAYEGPQGAHWGLWEETGELKPGMRAVFRGHAVECAWDGSGLPGGPGTPTLEFTYVPPIGSNEDLEGRLLHMHPLTHAIAVYIRVGSSWWTKPYWTSPLTVAGCDGSWVCDITTGGADTSANKVAAFVLPAGVAPPLMYGGSTLPASLYADSVDHLIVDR